MKKKILFSLFFVAVVCVLCLVPNCFATEEDTIVNIVDDDMKTYLVSVYDSDKDGEISVSELESAKTIAIYNYSYTITDLSFLEYCSNLTTLSISNLSNFTADLSCITNCSKTLTTLQLMNLELEESKLEYISELANLKTLNLSDNNITDLSFLENLTSLESLTLTENSMADLSFISNMTNLKTLNVSYNEITDLSFLQNLTNLETLYALYNNFTDISVINNLTNIKYLGVTGNPIDEVNLSNLANLETLICTSSGTITSITLNNLPSLTTLEFTTNEVSSISLTDVDALQVIKGENNEITDLSFLSGLNNLTTVNLIANVINVNEETNASIINELTENGVTLSLDNYYEEEGLYFELNEDETGYVVVDFFGKNITSVEVPATYNDLPVVEIGDEAFYRQYSDYNLESIVLPDSITKIGKKAFYNCTKLTSINMPANLTEISLAAFYSTSITEFILPEGLEIIGESAFAENSALVNISIPNTVTTIGSTAFAYCTSLTEIVIPDSVTQLGGTCEFWYEDYVFSGCSSLTSVTLSKNITHIGHNFFSGCTSLKELVIPEGVTTIEACFLGSKTTVEKLYLPKSFTTLNEVTTVLKMTEAYPTIYGYTGSYAEELAEEIGWPFVALDEEYTTKETEEVTVDGETVTVMPIDAKTSIEDLLVEENFPVIDTYTVTVYDAVGNEKDSTEKIGSKNIIQITDENGQVLAEYTVVVSGDVTGNGYARMYDSFLILRGSVLNSSLDELDLMIQDYNGDGKVRMYDSFLFLRDAVLGR